MKIVLINGGLGNQVFQYIFARVMELVTHEPVFLNDAEFFLEKAHNGLEMEKIFGLRLNLLSRHFGEDTWKEMIGRCRDGISIPRQLRESGMDLAIVAETEDFDFDGNVFYTPTNEYNPIIYKCRGTIYYHGYWINKWWFTNCRDTFLKELVFPPLESEENRCLAEMISRTPSISVHIRRGDFVTKHGWALPPEFYRTAVGLMEEKVKGGKFFLFSDDIPWCREHCHELGFDLKRRNVVFVTGNDSGRNYIDMQLMALCKHMIIANSSFSYLAVLLNQNEGKLLANPTKREV